MKGVYCLLLRLENTSTLKVGALGRRNFPAGTYVYVGSAQSGIESRVRRHKSKKKRLRWHIDFLLREADLASTVAIPCDRRSLECEVAKALCALEDASVPVRGFGSSDCRCPSHLVHFGDADFDWVAESISRRLAMLECVYPRTVRRR